MAIRAARDIRHQDTFNYSREHQHLVNIFKLRSRIAKEGYRHDRKLGFTLSSWHRNWIYSSAQIADLCQSLYLIRGEIEDNIINHKLDAQRRNTKSMDQIIECINWVIAQIELESPPAKRVILFRAEGKNFKEVSKLCPGRFYPSMLDDYTRFLRKMVGRSEYEFLRSKPQ